MAKTKPIKISKRTRKAIILAGVLVILSIGIAIGSNSETIFSPVEQGSIENIPEGVDLQEYVNQKVEEGMFQVFINTNITVNRKGKANLLIQNTEQNRHRAKIEIYEGDNLIYSSKTIKPGYKIEEDKIKGLSAGLHECVAYFNIYSDSGALVNKIGVNVKITQES